MSFYSSLQELDVSNHCFLHAPPPSVVKTPPCPRLPVPWVGSTMPRTNQIYAVNENPSNPLRCIPPPPKKK